MYRLLGLDPDQHRIKPNDFWDRVVDGDRVLVLRAMREAQRTRTDFTFDARLRRDDGVLVWLRGLGRYVLDARDGPRASAAPCRTSRTSRRRSCSSWTRSSSTR